MELINWALLGEAVEFYKSYGFSQIETPWYIDVNTINITCDNPQAIVSVDTNDEAYCPTYKGLVGSAEQGFLQLAKDGELPHVNYVSCGPCFRLEEFDELHQPQFMKVELFSRCENEQIALSAAKQLLYTSFKFMCLKHECHIVDTDDGYDIEINGIEVGSYGARHHKDIGWWAYGTGIAEPRFTLAINKGKEHG